MRILHVAHNLGGGLETAITDYVAAAPDHQHDLYYSTNPRCEIQRNDVFASEIRSDGAYREFIAGLRRAVRTLRPDVVHAQSSIAGALCRLAIPRSSRVRLVYTPHCFAFERRDISASKRKAFWRVERMLASRTAVLAACSPRELTLAHELGVPAVYVPNVARISVARAPAPGARPMRVVCSGRLTAQKDPGLLAAVARASTDAIDFTWIGGGDPKHVADLESAGVRVTGWVSRVDALDLLAGADVYVHTAAWEGAPLTILEAAAIGLPVLARETPAMHDLGLAPLWRDPADLLALLRDPAAVSQAARNSAELTARHTAEAQRDALEHVYTGSAPAARLGALPTEAVGAGF